MLLKTNRLELILQTPKEVLAWVDALPSEVRSEISPIWLERLKQSTVPDPWTCMFRIELKSDGSEIGSCGFKGAPDPHGIVEIAYGIETPYRNQGFATEAACALIEYALSLETVRVICAHTKTENLASERTVTKCGFKWIGQIQDPEDGLVNRWEIISFR